MDFKSEERKAYNAAYKGRVGLLVLCWIGTALAVIGFGIVALVGLIAEITGVVHSEVFPVVLGFAMTGMIPIMILGVIRCKAMFAMIVRFAAPLAILGWMILLMAFTFGLAIASMLGPVFLIIDTVKWFRMEPLP